MLHQGLLIDGPVEPAERGQRLQLAGKGKPGRRNGVEQRLDAEPVASQETGTRVGIKERQGPHPVESRQRVDAPAGTRGEHHLRVALGLEPLTGCGQLVSQRPVVVHLAVVDQDEASGVALHWLVAGRRGVQHSQSRRGQSHRPASLGVDPKPGVVRASVA